MIISPTRLTQHQRVLPGGGGVLPYMGYIGMCRGIGYGFWRFSILNRVSFSAMLA